MGSMKKKRKKRAKKEWLEFQNQHQLADADIQLARQTGYPLKRFQDLLGTDGSECDASKGQRIKDFYQAWQAMAVNRQAEIEAGGADPKKKKTAKISKHDPKWAEAKQLCRLNMDDIRKAKELGLSPQALIKNVPSASQAWKAPVKDWIQELYDQRIGRPQRLIRSEKSSSSKNQV